MRAVMAFTVHACDFPYAVLLSAARKPQNESTTSNMSTVVSTGYKTIRVAHTERGAQGGIIIFL